MAKENAEPFLGFISTIKVEVVSDIFLLDYVEFKLIF